MGHERYVGLELSGGHRPLLGGTEMQHGAQWPCHGRSCTAVFGSRGITAAARRARTQGTTPGQLVAVDELGHRHRVKHVCGRGLRSTNRSY